MYNACLVRFSAILLAICSMANTSRAQYYYKDIVVTAQINANYTLLKNNKVSHVILNPSAMEPGQNPVTLQQTINPSQNLLVTYTKVPDATESWLKSYYNTNGLLIKTVDSSADAVTTTLYEYGMQGHITRISSNAVPVNDPAEKEEHLWKYDNVWYPVQMLKIKNNNDTTVVSFVLDEQGNTGEEKAIHKKSSLGSVYYYYDAQKRLTDVARFNQRANRILPEYMFEYRGDAVQLSQSIIVPEGSADYQTWKYEYNAKGLKEKDDCYNKKKQLVASVTYDYKYF